MNPTTRVRLSILALLGLLSSPLAAQGGTKTGAAKPASAVTAVKLTIAVVDIVKASSHTKAARSGLERLKGMTASYQKKLDKLGETLKSLEMELQLLKDSPEKVDKEIEFRTLVQRQRLAKERYQKAIAQQQVDNDGQIYREVQAAIAELARKKGILLVLRKRSPISMEDVKEGGEAEAKRRQGNQDRVRDVLYAAPSIDLTEDLIKYLKG